jgi:hypothetical protein
MSKEPPPIDWDKKWAEYNKTLNVWMVIFESFQETTRVVQSMFDDLMVKALKESGTKTMSQFAENWQKSMSEAGINILKQFGDNWQNVFIQPGMEQLKAYGNMMKKFSEAYCWNEMWNK